MRFRKNTNRKEELPSQPYTKGTLCIQIGMTLVAILFIAPIFIILNYSFKGKKELYLSSPLSLPESFNLDNYIAAFKKLDLAGILIPYQALFLPIYTIGYKLHLTNTRFGIIFMYVATGVSFGVFLMNSFMSTVPLELEEAARIDGCSVFRTYISVVLPILKPAMATLIIMQAFQIWNDYLLASLYVSKKELKTLTVSIQSLFSAQSSDYTTAMAAIVISVLPIAILFLCLQKYFIKGMTVGAVKG